MTKVSIPIVFKINNLTYQLKGIICHSGNTIPSGHYYSVVRNDGKFLFIDDENIIPVSFPFMNKIKRQVSGIIYERD